MFLAKSMPKHISLDNKNVLGEKTAIMVKSGPWCAPAHTKIGLGGRPRCLFIPKGQSLISRRG